MKRHIQNKNKFVIILLDICYEKDSETRRTLFKLSNVEYLFMQIIQSVSQCHLALTYYNLLNEFLHIEHCPVDYLSQYHVMKKI